MWRAGALLLAVRGILAAVLLAGSLVVASWGSPACCAWDSCCNVAGGLSSCGELGLLLLAVRGILAAAASLVSEHGLQAGGFSSCGVCS